jgi:hypothetical protein
MVKWVLLTNGTEFGPTKAQWRLFGRLLDAANVLIVGSEKPHWDVSVIGRELARPGHSVAINPGDLAAVPSVVGVDPLAASVAGTLSHRLQRSNDSAHLSRGTAKPKMHGATATIVKAVRAETEPTASATPASATATTRVFWKSDYVVHKGADYTVTLRMVSNRTLNTECIAHENRHGKHLGAGAMFWYVLFFVCL